MERHTEIQKRNEIGSEEMDRHSKILQCKG